MIRKLKPEESDPAASDDAAAHARPSNDLPASPDNRSAVSGPGTVGSPGSDPPDSVSSRDAGQPGAAASDGRSDRKTQLIVAVIGGVFAIVAALVGAIAAGAFTSSGGGGASSSSSSPVSLSTGSLVPGDGSAFVRDVTYPDYSKVQANTHFTKIWELEDTGIVRWTGRYLAALGPSSGKCTYPARVSIPATSPGATVDISVKVTAPSTPGLCFVTWRMVTPSGSLYFPGDTSGIWFKVDVEAVKKSG
jgi:hypothetical protein